VPPWSAGRFVGSPGNGHEPTSGSPHNLQAATAKNTTSSVFRVTTCATSPCSRKAHRTDGVVAVDEDDCVVALSDPRKVRRPRLGSLAGVLSL
jgi:hypothetical protein